MVKIAPSILSADFAFLHEEIKKIEKGGADWVHIDVMDGHFVPNITMGPLVVEAIKKNTSLPLDVHLMVEKPERYVEQFVNAGADIVSVHTEASVHLNRTVNYIKSLGVKAGVALNPATSLTAVEYVLDDVDMVILMSVNPGFGGQELISSSLEKIRKLKNIISHRSVLIEVDGGINSQNASLVSEAGADVLVAGSAVFCQSDTSLAIKLLRTKKKMV